MDASVATKVLTRSEKEEILREILGNDYHKIGNNMPILMDAIDIISKTDNALTFAELIPGINTFVAGSRIFSVVSSGAAVLSIILFPVSAMISVINAYQIGHKMYSYRAIAYTITAWAFGKPIPSGSQKVLHNVREGRVVAKTRVLGEYKEVWRKTSAAVMSQLNIEIASKNIPKEAVQVAFRAIGKNNEQTLTEMILKGYEEEFDAIGKLSWKSNYDIKFPF